MAPKVTKRLPSADARDIDNILRALGYTLVRSKGGHLVYSHPTQNDFVTASTPSDRRGKANVLADLKRRHPTAPVFERRKSSRPKPSTASKSPRKMLSEWAASKGIPEAKVVSAIRSTSSLGEAKRVLEGKAHAPAPYVPTKRVMEVRLYRCGDCGHPWSAETYSTAQACPRSRCQSENVTVEKKRQAA